jgi:hypothetical protein
VYIHLNADNNLCSFAPKDMAELQTLDVSNNSNVIVSYDCDQVGDSKIIEVQGKEEIDVSKKILGLNAPSEFDMGSINFFKSTASKVFEEYPSNRRMIIIWNHGSGWNLMSEDFLTKGVSYDDNSGSHFTTVQVGQAIKDIASLYTIDIVGYDACLMQMAEVSYEYADFAKFTLASEDLEPGEGWDYKALVAALDKGNSISTEEFGKMIVDGFTKFYQNDKVTLSLIDNTKLSDLVKGLADIVPDLKKQIGMKKIVASVPGWTGSGKDLGIFLSKLPETYTGKLRELYKDTIIYSGATQPATGLAIYLTSRPSALYKDLKFEKDTGWFSFLTSMKP